MSCGVVIRYKVEKGKEGEEEGKSSHCRWWNRVVLWVHSSVQSGLNERED